MARKVKRAEGGLPEFPTPADVHEFAGKLWAEEFRHELKKLNRTSQRAADTYLKSFGLPSDRIPEKEAFFRLAEKKTVGELCLAHGMAILYTSAHGAERPRSFSELDNMIGRMIESKGKREGLSLCAFENQSPEIAELRAEGAKFIAVKDISGSYCVLGEVAGVFPESYFTKQALKGRDARLSFVKPISEERWEECENALRAEFPEAEITRWSGDGIPAKYLFSAQKTS